MDKATASDASPVGTMVGDADKFWSRMFQGNDVVAIGLASSGEWRQEQYFAAGVLGDEIQEAAQSNDVYFTPVPQADEDDEDLNPNRIVRAQSIAQPGRAIYADCDHGLTDEQRERALNLGATLVRSGSITPDGRPKYHVYVWLEEATDPRIIRFLNIQLMGRLNGDTKFDTAAVLRVPGTLNRKTDPPRPVTIEHLGDMEGWNPRDLAIELGTELPSDAELDEFSRGEAASREKVAEFLASATQSSVTGAAKGFVSKFRSLVADGLSRHGAMRDVLCWAMREAQEGRCSAEEATQAIQDVFTASVAGERSRNAGSEFRAALAWAVGQLPDDKEATAKSRFDRDVEDALHREKVRTAVKVRLASEGWEPPPTFGTMAEELLIEDGPIQWTVEGLHVTGFNTLVVAKYKTGKTTLALNLMRAFADSTPFLGEYKTSIPEGGQVAWWNFELDSRTARRWVRRMDVQNPERLVHLGLRGYAMPITSPVAADWAVNWLKQHNIKIWIVDPWGAAFDGVENDNNDVREWTKALDIIKRRAGVEDVFLVAHTGRGEAEEGQEHVRGATRLDGWRDVQWMYTKDPEAPELRWMYAHGRDVDVPTFSVEFDAEKGILSRSANEGKVDSRSKWDRMMAKHAERMAAAAGDWFRKTGEGIQTAEIKAVLGPLANDKKGTALSYAISNGYVIQKPGKGNSKLHFPGPGYDGEKIKIHTEDQG
ncbi:AAA family ATPase [Streptomyces sp. NPDC006261]|uniref:AAA family ATPase n=1 Tax=Streptomyces sp. NPDC006261 TaxID=3156739 RepID=UPI0033BE0BE1